MDDQGTTREEVIVVNEFNKFNNINKGDTAINTESAFRIGYWNVFYSTNELIAFLDKNKISYSHNKRSELSR